MIPVTTGDCLGHSSAHMKTGLFWVRQDTVTISNFAPPRGARLWSHSWNRGVRDAHVALQADIRNRQSFLTPHTRLSFYRRCDSNSDRLIRIAAVSALFESRLMSCRLLFLALTALNSQLRDTCLHLSLRFTWGSSRLLRGDLFSNVQISFCFSTASTRIPMKHI